MTVCGFRGGREAGPGPSITARAAEALCVTLAAVCSDKKEKKKESEDLRRHARLEESCPGRAVGCVPLPQRLSTLRPDGGRESPSELEEL